MGADLSASFDQIMPIFTTGFWKVHSAVKKNSGEKVSLWLFDNQKMLDQNKQKTDNEKYLESCIYSIQQIRKLRHPHILKILEANENPKQIAFSAEPIHSCLVNERSLTTDEVEYIGKQLISALDFLHENANIAHLGISPTSIVLTEDLTLKLCSFNFSSSIIGESYKVFPKYGNWNPSPFLPDVNFSAPELTLNQTITKSADIFSFGVVLISLYMQRNLFTCKSPHEILRKLSDEYTLTIPNVTEPISKLLKSCISVSPETRPSIIQIESTLNSVQTKVYQYIDNILTKKPAEKFNFYKSLIRTLDIFSERMNRIKLMPLFMKETLEDERYCPVTIPLIFQIGSLYTKREFNNEILIPLYHFLTVTKPPEQMLAVFSVLNILLEKVEPERHYEVIFPIFQAALKPDTDIRIQNTAIAYLPLILKTINSSVIREVIIPKLCNLISESDNEDIIANSILTLSDCHMKVDPDTFAEISLPKITIAWGKFKSTEIADAIVSLLKKLDVTLEVSLQNIIPLASKILSSPNYLSQQSQKDLIEICQNTFANVIDERKLEKNNIDRKQKLQPKHTKNKPMALTNPSASNSI
ncbi:protein kinase [Histomonas meleagridis]|uniref:protein kinase n=1 Tax=Histomonas meleagridis TaxID=135588 RepID=UPI00355AC405|nr:protein kinase [Histomonas meleagridis]KAH0797724.1 protein kinase [Histomonas meleagridis]